MMKKIKKGTKKKKEKKKITNSSLRSSLFASKANSSAVEFGFSVINFAKSSAGSSI